MRTKWQSGSAVGNAAPGRRKGNRPIGNEGCAPGKSSPYLSRKIYLICCRRLAFFVTAECAPSRPLGGAAVFMFGRRSGPVKIRKRSLALLLTLAMALGLTACGGKEEEAWDGGPVYMAEALDYTSEQLRIMSGCAVGDSFYLVDIAPEKLASGPTRRDVDRIQRISLEDGAAQPLPAYQMADTSEAQRKYILSSVLRPGTDGTLWQTMKLANATYALPEGFDEENGDWEPYKTKNWQGWVLRRLDTEGRELFRFEEEAAALESRLGIGRISDLLMDGDGEIAAIGEKGAAVLSMDGALRFTLPVEEPEFINYPPRLILMGDGGVGMAEYAVEGDSHHIRLQTIDKDARSWGRKYLAPAFGGVFDGTGDVLFYYLAGDELRTWREDTQDAGKGETVLNWANVGINAKHVSIFAAADGGRLLTVTEDRGEFDFDTGVDGEQELFLLTAAEKPDRKTLTYATLGIQNNVERAAILAFNRTNPDYQIVVKDYTDYSPNASREDAIMRLAAEIGAGKAPDILATENMPVEQWGASGLLEDLWPWIDQDPDISREDLMERVFEAMEVDGKLYEVTDSFRFWTLMGAKELVGDRMSWTPADMETALAKLPEGSIGIDEGGTALLLNILNLDWSQYVDWGSGTCSFDSEEFRDLLEFCGGFPESASGERWERVNDGWQLVCSIYPMSFESVQVAEAVVGGEASFVGYPNNTGRAGSGFLVSGTLAMSSGCRYKEGAWAFLRSLLLPRDTLGGFDNSHQFFTNKELFEKSMKKAMNTPPSPYAAEYGAISVSPRKVTQEDCDQIMELYNAVDTVCRSNPSLETIITEAAGAYFAGDKTLEETAELIQNRAALYVSEQS